MEESNKIKDTAAGQQSANLLIKYIMKYKKIITASKKLSTIYIVSMISR